MRSVVAAKNGFKVLHVPFCFYPDPIGGTEVYVEGLARALLAYGVRGVIAAPGVSDASYRHGQLPVRRFTVARRITDLRQLYGAGDAVAAAAFGRVLDDEAPDIVHLHAFTSAISIRLVDESRRRGLPVVFTYHTPTVSCQRGSLMRWGTQVCDGVLSVSDCAACSLHGHGIPRRVSTVLGKVPVSVGRLTGRVAKSGGPTIALRMTELLSTRHAALRSLLNSVDVVVAVSGWVRELLLRNGVAEERIRFVPQGLMNSVGALSIERSRDQHSGGPIRIAYVGRLDPVKGVDVLIRAVRSIASVQVRLDIYGVIPDSGSTDYVRNLETLAHGDPRITFCPPVPNEQVVPTLRGYHLLAAPSQWLETGPLVVLEAFAAGIPVVGSRLGGIAELVHHEVDGLLVDAQSESSWHTALERLVNNEEGLVDRLRSGVRPPRRMTDVAREMLDCYTAIRSDALERGTPLACMPQT